MPDVQIRQINDRLDIAYDQHQYLLRIRKGAEWRARKFTKDKHRLMLLAMELGASKTEALDAVKDLPETFGEFLADRVDEYDGRGPAVSPRTDETPAER